MALALTSRTKRRDQIVAVDLGSRATKAVLLQRKGEGFTLARFAILDAPIYEKNITPDLLSEHLRTVMQMLEAKVKPVTMSLGVAESILRNTELPPMPVPEMRLMLKYNTKNYLQQDLPDYTFDCSIVAPKAEVTAEQKATPKYKVWVGGAKNQLLNDLQVACKMSGLTPDLVVLSILGPVNAFELAQPEVYQKEVTALVDIGFKNSTINIICQGELMLSRVVGIGGDKLTTGLAEAISVSYAEAENIKIGMPQEVESSLQPLLSPLGRELRASIDFFEHQHDKTVGQALMSGGAARSDFIMQVLQAELMVPCKSWDPTSFLGKTLPPQQMAEIEGVAPQLTVAIGAAVSAF
jgi:type IV pilus assembly protein PilM